MSELKQKLQILMQQKKLLVVAGISVGLIAVIGIFFLANYSSMPSYSLPFSLEVFLVNNVDPSQMRSNICGEFKGGLYDQICSSEFNNIAKNDDDKLLRLFGFIRTIEDDTSISDFDKYFLSNLIFSSLPTKDSPSGAVVWLRSLISDFLRRPSLVLTAHAQRELPKTNMRDFDEQMARDLVSAVYDLPKGDNAWVIQTMVSQYAWVDGKRQPIYSEQYSEVFDPFPNAFPESGSISDQLRSLKQNGPNVTSHLRSFIGSISVGIDESKPNMHEQTGVKMAYSFTIQSWYSDPTGHDESVPEKKLQSRRIFSEEGWQGTNHMNEFLSILERVEKNSSSRKMTQRRNTALEARKNFNAKNRRVQTRSRQQTSPSDQPFNLEDAYFGTTDGLMPRACEAILAKMPDWKRQTNSDGSIVSHGWEEFIKDGKNAGGVVDLGTCDTSIIFEERDLEDVQISIRGFDVTRERNEEYQKLPKIPDLRGGYQPTTAEEIYEKRKKDWIESERNQSAKKNKFIDIFEGKGFVATYYFDSSIEKNRPDPSSDSYATILSGKCAVSFSGYSWPNREEDFLYEERVSGPQGRSLLKKYGSWSGLYGKYHYTEYSYDSEGNNIGSEVINVHPGFDHGFEELHQKMILLAPQIVEAIKPFCK